MMTLAPYSMLIVFGLLAQADTDAPIKPKQNIDQVSKRMTDAGYRQTPLEIIATSQQNELRFWDLDPGVLSVLYSKKSGEIINLTYMLNNEGPKTGRRPIKFKIVEFDPVSRDMKIKLPDKPKPKTNK